MKSSSRTQYSPGRIGTVSNVNPRRSAMPGQQKVQARETIRGNEQLAAMQHAIRQRRR